MKSLVKNISVVKIEYDSDHKLLRMNTNMKLKTKKQKFFKRFMITDDENEIQAYKECLKTLI